MIWHKIENGFNTGKYNMEFDLGLAKNCKPGESIFRLYRWEPYCISLGANQKLSDVNLEKVKDDGLDIVHRPTGGRAILHAEEITYSVVLHYSNTLTAKVIYQKVSNGLLRGLKKYNPLLQSVELENEQPDFPDLLKKPSGMMCFASTAKNEVKFNHKKLIGSAQRKLNNIILQHGSILCGNFHERLIDYLDCNENEYNMLKNELKSSTIDLKTILNKDIDYDYLSKCLIEGFEEEWQIKFLSKKKEEYYEYSK
jgi:lipoate-protein ligase A